MSAPTKAFSRAMGPFYRWLLDATNNGAVPEVDGLTVDENGVGPLRKTTLTLDAVELALADEADTVAYVGQKLYDFPEGAIMLVGARADLTVEKDAAGVDDDFNGDFSLGTATAGNDATLSSTEADVIPSTAIPEATDGASTLKGVSTSTEGAKIIDGTTTPVDLFLNILVDDADQDVTGTPTNVAVSGTIDIFWINLGDI